TVTCPVRELIAIIDRLSPNLECYLHGNLPVQTSPPFAEEESESNREQVAAAVSRSSTRDLFVPVPGRTRVDVDLKGRRSLVNDLR
ncbi:MAG TPA: hypothetical protein VJ751_11760, partial [Pyrinomonadaceae bacterium]|nr:hypothetical protein [Pyrinomonadaceae bacterium]